MEKTIKANENNDLKYLNENDKEKKEKELTELSDNKQDQLQYFTE
jgi:hypothetical protein